MYVRIAANTDAQTQNVHVTQIWPWLHIHFYNTALLHLKEEEESTGKYVYTYRGDFSPTLATYTVVTAWSSLDCTTHYQKQSHFQYNH